MILLKVGSAPNADIVLNSPYVSSQHAEILVGDDGSVMIEDKNSTNGTFVNKKRLTPNSRQLIRRGDLVTFGNESLQWHQVPVLPDMSKFKQVISIGSDFNNDINVTNQFASRYHATLYVDKDGKVFITDYNSRNGTEVNGTRIQKKKQVRIKRGDNITVGSTDITDMVAPYIPGIPKWVKSLAIGIGAVIILGIIGGLVSMFINRQEPVPPIEEIQSSVVLVYGQYTMYVEIEDNPIHEDIWNRVMELTGYNYTYGCLPLESDIPYSGTAFFLDQSGRMATNRHVAVPWEYAEETKKKEFRSAAEQYIHNQLPSQINEATVEAYDQSNSLLWAMVKLQTRIEGNNSVAYASSLIRQLNNTKRNVVGKIDYFGVAYPGRHYDSRDEFERCTMLDYAKDADIDLALIQLNDPHTPASVKWVFDPGKFNLEKLKPQGCKLTWIGYPNGIVWARDIKTHQLRPQVRETMCSSAPSKYDFDIQGEIVGGASGSPVFETATGQLVGVAYARLIGGATFGRAVQAKYLKEMYDAEVK